ncbi:hypothetical protein i01_02221 [Escherichia coli cloneA_i1]|nr:FAD-binding and (Fe-S)-binding domain-containing protein [Escherichia coli]EHG00984.1 hypothetical protein i01_02221 [Escherichia coli cloneA_i1]
MIPQISQAPGVVQLVLNFLQELEQQGFTGDTATSYADRLTMSTDNSIYQLLPDAVVFPRSTADVALIARLAAQERYSSLIFTPRGGGTGTNGQALNQGIIVDMSRHMNRIIEINPEEGWVRVEAGVIKDQLNQYLKPFGYFFAPELSTSNRATLGGMINTDASGQGSLVYGKTSDHVLGVRAVLLGGDILDTQPLPVELAETLGKSNTTIGRIYNTVYQRCRQQRQLIIDNFPKLNRFLTGYDLRHVFNDEMTEFDLTRILTGSEGTLAFITEARLDITRLPKVRRLVNVKYDSFDSALRNAPFMVEARALSVETVDSKVLNLAREDIVWHSVSELITDVPDKEMLGLNIVEFAGDDEALIDERVNALCVRLDELIASQQAGVIGWQVCRELAGVERIYAMRKKAVGLLSDDVVALTAKYGGLLWGEHGKGFRAEYSPAFFGEELFAELRKVKAAFDPYNRLNPGKICPPEGLDAPMMKVDAVKRGTFDRQIPIAVRQQWRGAMECNGNGLCFNFDARSPMCPSMKITQNRIHSPKGRATLVREWLRLLADRGVDPLKLEQELPESGVSLRTLIARTRNSWHANKGEYDFSHEVKEAMSGCLACKACSTQCPIKIDVPEFRSRFLQLYHTRYLRPLRDHLVATVESYAPLMARAPKTFNFFINQPLVRKLSEKHIGMVDLPLLSVPSLQQQMVGHRSANMTLEQLEALNAEQKARTVLVVQDPFTSYYDAQVVADFVRLVEKLGFQPVLLPFSPNGKAQHIKGFLNRFAKTAKKTADFLNRMAKLGMPMVGVDPALVLCYRDEYKLALGEERGEFNVLLANEWLASALDSQPVATVSGESWYFFGHCTEVTALPGAPAQWAAIFARFGAKLENVSVGCCGMAGTYGHEAKNHKNSLRIYELSWHQAMQRLPRNRCLATGYSCRSQVKRVEGTGVRHPVQALLEIIK